jgi:hypothetical protein
MTPRVASETSELDKIDKRFVITGFSVLLLIFTSILLFSGLKFPVQSKSISFLLVPKAYSDWQGLSALYSAEVADNFAVSAANSLLFFAATFLAYIVTVLKLVLRIFRVHAWRERATYGWSKRFITHSRKKIVAFLIILLLTILFTLFVPGLPISAEEPLRPMDTYRVVIITYAGAILPPSLLYFYAGAFISSLIRHLIREINTDQINTSSRP